MKSIIMVLGFACLMAAQAHALGQTGQMSRDVLDALQGETIEGPAVPLIIKALHDVTGFDRDCDAAPKLIVVYRGEHGSITLVLSGRPCMTVTGPADGIRGLIVKIQGQPA